MTIAEKLLPATTTAPSIRLEGLDQLWFQVSGTRCNLSCTHCFNESGPESTTFGFLTLAKFRTAMQSAIELGVREYYFTGGEPLLNRDLPVMVAEALLLGPVTILTNGTVLPERTIAALKKAEEDSRYSLELRVSLDGENAERNDPLRGAGTFERILDGVSRLAAAGFLPILTVTQTWPEEDSMKVLESLQSLMRERGCDRPRIKILPALKIGREAERTSAYEEEDLVTEEMLTDYDPAQLLCSQARVVTDRGVWVCPILILAPDANLGEDLQTAAKKEYPLVHRACYTCWQYGAICSNFPGATDVS